MDKGVLLETKTLPYMPQHPEPDARIFRISRLLITYEVRKFPAIYKTFTRHLEISKIYSSFKFAL
jgi:hypothetical protein